MRSRRLATVSLLAVGALALGSTLPAFADPIEDLLAEVHSGRLAQVADYVADQSPGSPVTVKVPALVVVGEIYAPVDADIRHAQGNAGQKALDLIGDVDVRANEVGEISTARLDNVAEFVNGACGNCAPGLGNPIGPVPIGPVGDEVRNRANDAIYSVNASYARYGRAINKACGNCAPGLGNPIGPVPIGPVGDEDPTT